MRLSNLLSLAALLSVVESVPLGTRDTNNQAGKKKEQKEIIINGVSLKQKYFRRSTPVNTPTRSPSRVPRFWMPQGTAQTVANKDLQGNQSKISPTFNCL